MNPSTDSIFRYDPHMRALRDELEKQPESHRVAFAAVNCERLLPFHDLVMGKLREEGGGGDSRAEDFLPGQAEVIPKVIGRLWEHATGKSPMSPEEAQQWLDEIEEIDLGEEDWCDYWAEALDALGATGTALQTVTDDSAAAAALAAGTITASTMDRVLAEKVLPTQNQILAPDDLRALGDTIQAHPVMQREQLIHQRQLEYLAGQKAVTEETAQNLRRIAAELGGDLLEVCERMGGE